MSYAQSCPTLGDLMDSSLPGSSVYGIFQARILEWIGIPFSILNITFANNPGGFIEYLSMFPALCAVLCLVAQLYPILCDSMDYSLPGSSVHGDSPGNNTGVGYHALPQGIFPTQGLNAGLPQRRQIVYCLSHQGSPSTELQEKLKACLSIWKDIACLCIECFIIKMSVLC